MGKVPVRLRSITYTLSPFEQKVMSGLWKDWSHEIQKKISYNFVDVAVCAVPVLGTVWYANWYREQEKHHERF
eukprot:jgi/Mesen1/10633/ME000894S10202